MPSGDAQRTWFPEMIVRLRSEWYQGMSKPALISLRDELDGMLQRIRTGHHIQTPIAPWCEPVPVFEALAKRFPNHEMVVTSDYLDWGFDEYETYVLKNSSVVSKGRQQYTYLGEECGSGEQS